MWNEDVQMSGGLYSMYLLAQNVLEFKKKEKKRSNNTLIDWSSGEITHSFRLLDANKLLKNPALILAFHILVKSFCLLARISQLPSIQMLHTKKIWLHFRTKC